MIFIKNKTNTDLDECERNLEIKTKRTKTDKPENNFRNDKTKKAVKQEKNLRNGEIYN